MPNPNCGPIGFITYHRGFLIVLPLNSLPHCGLNANSAWLFAGLLAIWLKGRRGVLGFIKVEHIKRGRDSHLRSVKWSKVYHHAIGPLATELISAYGTTTAVSSDVDYPRKEPALPALDILSYQDVNKPWIAFRNSCFSHRPTQMDKKDTSCYRSLDKGLIEPIMRVGSLHSACELEGGIKLAVQGICFNDIQVDLLSYVAPVLWHYVELDCRHRGIDL
ncbi:hypothetical protein VNO77_26669 [Canavalia gladiata]|uniref:Uncharacterized protein n=1 Tax=Canavalia gladiata TaxID=3824 RepID=A0AAN9KSP7_CANGL